MIILLLRINDLSEILPLVSGLICNQRLTLGDLIGVLHEFFFRLGNILPDLLLIQLMHFMRLTSADFFF